MYLIALSEDEWSVAVQVLEHGSGFLARKVEDAKTIDQLLPAAIEAAARQAVSSWDHLSDAEIEKAMPDVRNQVELEVRAALESIS